MLVVKTESFAPGRISAEVEVEVSIPTRLVFVAGRNEQSILVRFQLRGQWYFQALHWSCRAGRSVYWRAVKKLYRLVRAQGLTDHTLRYLGVLLRS